MHVIIAVLIQDAVKMRKDFGQYFGLVFLFGLFVTLVSLYRQEDSLILRPIFRSDPTEPPNKTKTEISVKEWPFDFPILEGWPPGNCEKNLIHFITENLFCCCCPHYRFNITTGNQMWPFAYVGSFSQVYQPERVAPTPHLRQPPFSNIYDKVHFVGY
jgi:hypothetical protein